MEPTSFVVHLSDKAKIDVTYFREEGQTEQNGQHISILLLQKTCTAVYVNPG